MQQDATQPDAPVSRALTEEPVPLVKKTDALTEQEAANQPSVFGRFIAFAPIVLYILSGVLFVGGVVWLGFLFAPALTDRANFNLYETIVKAFSPTMLGLGGSLCLFLIGYVCSKVRQGLRDRVLA